MPANRRCIATILRPVEASPLGKLSQGRIYSESELGSFTLNGKVTLTDELFPL